MKYPTTAQIRARKQWALDQWKKHPLCMCCGKRIPRPSDNFGTPHVHHIAYRGRAPKRYEVPCNWLLVCTVRGTKHGCHEWLHNGPRKPTDAEVLAMKAVCDPDSFNLEEWLGVRGGGPDRVTLEQVVEASHTLAHLRHAFTLHGEE